METNLVDGFVKSVSRWPDRPALEIAGQRLTYSELGRHVASTALALTERVRAAHEPHLTAILGSRSIDAFAGVLAALVCGDGYVPLSPRWPVARLQHVIESTGCRNVIVDEGSLDVLMSLLGIVKQRLRLVLPTEDMADRVRQQGADCEIAVVQSTNTLSVGELALQRQSVDSEAIAYLLFTSGSTGTPKGVMIAQRNVTAFLEVARARFQCCETDRFSQTFDLTFDLSIIDMFLTWGVGGCLCCPSPEELLDISTYVSNCGLTVFGAVPTLAAELQGQVDPDGRALDALRLCWFCGEALSISVLEKWRQAAPNARLENVYGPTELTVFCTAYEWRPAADQDLHENGVVCIGQPLSGMTALIVDESLAPVVKGTPGELLMAGPQVSLGYWKNREKTRSSFVVPPGQQSRFYRTGDLVREIDDNGNLVYLGRTDHQIKVRGHRVELGEIEAALRDVAQVDTAVALGWPESPSGCDGIVAFIAKSSVEMSTITAKLAGRLPVYMVPTQIRPVERFVTTLSGKIDRKALRAELWEVPTRRQAVRFPMRLGAEVSFGTSSIQGRTLNLSCGGMLFEGSQRLEIGTILHCRLELDDEEPPVRLVAVVQYVTPDSNAAGLQFLPGHDEAVNRIRNGLLSRAALSLEDKAVGYRDSRTELARTASFLREIGDPDNALGIYRIHLTRHPDDMALLADASRFFLDRIRELGIGGWVLVLELEALLERITQSDERGVIRLAWRELDQIKKAIDRRSPGNPGRERMALESIIAQIWRDVLGGVTVGWTENLLEAGANSISVARFVQRLEKEFGFGMNATEVLRLQTVSALADHVRLLLPTGEVGETGSEGRAAITVQKNSAGAANHLQLLTESSDPSAAFWHLNPKGSKLPLVLFPPASGVGWFYLPICQWFDQDRPLLILNVEPMHTRSPAFCTVEESIPSFTQMLRRYYPEGPFILGGHSFGGLTAFEMALSLAANGEKRTAVVMFDTGAPSPGWIRTVLPLYRRILTFALSYKRLFRPLVKMALGSTNASEEALRQLRFHFKMDPYVGYTKESLADLWNRVFLEIPPVEIFQNGSIESVIAKLFEQLKIFEKEDLFRHAQPAEQLQNWQIFNAGRRAEMRYVPRHHYHGPVAVFTVSGNRSWHRWKRYTSGSVSQYPVEALVNKELVTHNDILEKKNLSSLVPALNKILDDLDIG